MYLFGEAYRCELGVRCLSTRNRGLDSQRQAPRVHFPPSPQKGFKVTAKWSSQKPSKQEEIVVGHGLTTIFLCMQSIDLTAYP